MPYNNALPDRNTQLLYESGRRYPIHVQTKSMASNREAFQIQTHHAPISQGHLLHAQGLIGQQCRDLDQVRRENQATEDSITAGGFEWKTDGL